MLRALALAWWFIGISQPGGTPHVYGPFADKAQCEQMREHLSSRFCCKPPTWCWWDGK